MLNYGETLAYWYLRLNGFLLIQDFVLHENAQGTVQPSDIDMLGIRFPYVREPIGGQADDWDEWLRARVGPGFVDSPIAIICEVKTGPCDTAALERAFSKDRLSTALNRIGVWKATDQIASSLVSVSSFRQDMWVLMKVAFVGDNVRSPLFNTIRLKQADGFIKRRVERYRDRKYAHRLFFQDPLMEYLVWRAHEDGR